MATERPLNPPLTLIGRLRGQGAGPALELFPSRPFRPPEDSSTFGRGNLPESLQRIPSENPQLFQESLTSLKESLEGHLY